MIKDKDIQVAEVIISKLLLRGNGVDDPYRRVTQVFDKDGELIAEKDSETFITWMIEWDILFWWHNFDRWLK